MRGGLIPPPFKKILHEKTHGCTQYSLRTEKIFIPCRGGFGMYDGWIKLYRKILDSEMYQKLNSKQRDVMITCLLLASHKETKWEYKGEIYTIKPGQFVTSLESLKKHCASDVTIQNIRTALKKLETWGFLTNKSTKTGRLITIVNWELYQSNDDVTNKETNKELTKNQQRANKELTTIKNNKNEKEYKEVVVVVDNSQQQLKKIFEVFEQNIHPPTPLEIKKLESWLEDVEADVVIMAIEEAVKNNVRKLSYIEKILKTWVAQGLKTKADVEAYRRDWQDRKAGSETQPINQPIKTLTEQLKEKYGNLLAGDSG